MKHIVVVGGGFGGLRVIRQLRGEKDIKITLVSDLTDFRYSPALWRTATGRRRRESSIPLDGLISSIPHASFTQGKVVKIDRQSKLLTLSDGREISYDYCVIALGVTTSFFNIPGLDTYSYSIKSAHEVERLKRHLHHQLTEEQSLDKNYIIVGAGPTGIELSAAFGQYLRRIGKAHNIASPTVTIELIEAADRVLPTMSPRASRIATKKLERLGIKVSTGQKVEGETASTLRVNDRSIPTHTVIWTAGVSNNEFFAKNPSQFQLDSKGRVVVDGHFQIDNSLFVIGDNAAVPFAGLAQTAIHHANYAAATIRRLISGQTPKPFYPKKPISAVPLGNTSAIIEWRGYSFDGILGGIIRGLADLIGYADIMGYMRAIAIWRIRDEYEESCPVCRAPRVTP